MSKRKCREQNHTSYYERTLMREAMRDHLMEINPTYFVTLASNFNTISLVSMKKKLRNWDAHVNREIVGPNWQKRRDLRTSWIAFPEKMDTNPHWHLLVQLPDPIIEKLERRSELQGQSLEDILKSKWARQLKSGTCDVQYIRNTRRSMRRVCWYTTKYMINNDNVKNYVISGEY